MVFPQRFVQAQKKAPFERAAKPGEDCLRAHNVVSSKCNEGAATPQLWPPCDVEKSFVPVLPTGITRHGPSAVTPSLEKRALGGSPQPAQRAQKTIDNSVKLC